jgi:hypothetical protein
MSPGFGFKRCSELEAGSSNATQQLCSAVIPAKAGIHRQYEAWIPAFAGMTLREN